MSDTTSRYYLNFRNAGFVLCVIALWQRFYFGEYGAMFLCFFFSAFCFAMAAILSAISDGQNIKIRFHGDNNTVIHKYEEKNK